MKNDWEIFEGRQYKPTARREPRVTVGPKGTFYLNGIAFEALDQPAAVEMLLQPQTTHHRPQADRSYKA